MEGDAVQSHKRRRDCPYLDTIKRSVLDFDFEKVCSVSLSNLNVYACLVCGKYFQGRGRGSHAHYHSLQQDHHVFINLHTMKVYCLPDDYEVIESSLDDIKFALNPTFTNDAVSKLDTNTQLSRALDGTEYLPGIVGLNNIKLNDSINVILQSLARVPALRDFFIFPENYSSSKSGLVHKFGELVRKMWNPKLFKAQVSPHEVLQEISAASAKKYRIGQKCDPIDFLSWFLNTLHTHLSKKKTSNIIHEIFQGEIEISTDKKALSDGDVVVKTEKQRTPFLFLSVDVPPPPLFKNEQEANIIPQVPLYTCLEKYNNVTCKIQPNGENKRYIITKLPKYLIIHIRRFTKNTWFVEKNPTIVNFPIKNLELKDFLLIQENIPLETIKSKYDLLSSIRHEGNPNQGSYYVYILNKGNEKWFEVQDLMVTEAMPQLIALSEAYVQIYEQKDQ